MFLSFIPDKKPLTSEKVMITAIPCFFSFQTEFGGSVISSTSLWPQHFFLAFLAACWIKKEEKKKRDKKHMARQKTQTGSYLVVKRTERQHRGPIRTRSPLTLCISFPLDSDTSLDSSIKINSILKCHGHRHHEGGINPTRNPTRSSGAPGACTGERGNDALTLSHCDDLKNIKELSGILP